jgi:sugar lactone lactonase YvrE
LPTPTVFATDLHFPECPRWHDGALWLSDMWGHTVYRFDPDGTRHVVHRFPDDEDPGGLGWLPDGRMLVAGMLGRVVYRLQDGAAVVHADLRAWAPHEVNDMIVGPDGSAYVTQFGHEMWGTHADMGPTVMIRVTGDGGVSVGADDLMIPNGVAVADDGKTLVVAESAAARLSRFSVRDGLLSDRRQVPLTPAADMPFVAPDGICLDAEGGVWAADPLARRVIHLSDDTIDQEIPVDDFPLACVLGGEDRRTLFLCVNQVWSKPDRRPEPTGSVVTVRVDVPGAGWP